MIDTSLINDCAKELVVYCIISRGRGGNWQNSWWVCRVYISRYLHKHVDIDPVHGVREEAHKHHFLVTFYMGTETWSGAHSSVLPSVDMQ